MTLKQMGLRCIGWCIVADGVAMHWVVGGIVADGVAMHWVVGGIVADGVALHWVGVYPP